MTFVSRRSPWMIPRPLGPGSVTKPDEPVLRLLLAAAWRPRALALSFAAALSRVPGGGPQLGLHARIGRLLACSEGCCALARARGDSEVETRVASRLAGEPLPNCASWAEVAVAEATFGRALEEAFGRFVDSSDEAISALARDGGPGSPGEGEALAAMARDAKNLECLQILVDRWMPAAVQVFGRPGATAEPPLLKDRIKTNASTETLSAFLDGVEQRLGALGLWLPDAARMGLTAPAGWSPHRGRG